ncbi:unnamed protein product [Thlaspi arvense]|uniref:Uncharacterized protein n=1 Tax=Thlaspi arvense TaxID=13288 RepID=A0AAU9SWF0_THLAR|nr:unnamed protein product [Thlaspi arvense]
MPSLLSIGRVLDKALASVSSVEEVQNSLVHHTLKLTSLLHESAKRSIRERASLHNSSSWLLPPELTIKLDTKSLMQAMACCNMFHKCAKDPASYSHINLTSARKVDDGVVSTLINRAGKELRFLEIGHVDGQSKSKTPHLLNGSCLAPLSHNHGFIGKYLRSLHLYDVRSITDNLSIDSLSACSNITDLKMVGVYSPSEKLLKSLAVKCRFIEHLFFETYGSKGASRKDSSALAVLLTNLPSLTSLTLINLRLRDATVQTLAKGSRKLKHLNLSRNSIVKGCFLRESGHCLQDSALETLILRDCSSLEEKEVLQFFDSLLAENFRFIRHIDVSNSRGLLSDDGKRSCKPKFPLKKLKKERPDVKIVANFNPTLSRSQKRSQGNDAEVQINEVGE